MRAGGGEEVHGVSLRDTEDRVIGADRRANVFISQLQRDKIFTPCLLPELLAFSHTYRVLCLVATTVDFLSLSLSFWRLFSSLFFLFPSSPPSALNTPWSNTVVLEDPLLKAPLPRVCLLPSIATLFLEVSLLTLLATPLLVRTTLSVHFFTLKVLRLSGLSGLSGTNTACSPSIILHVRKKNPPPQIVAKVAVTISHLCSSFFFSVSTPSRKGGRCQQTYSRCYTR